MVGFWWNPPGAGESMSLGLISKAALIVVTAPGVSAALLGRPRPDR
jgi:hypothetical protein